MIFWNFKNLLTFIFCCIWNFCEYFGISLGKYAPDIFGLALGSKGWEKVEKKDKQDNNNG